MPIRYIDLRPRSLSTPPGLGEQPGLVPQLISAPPVYRHIASLVAAKALPSDDIFPSPPEQSQGTAAELYTSLHQDPLWRLVFIDLTGVPADTIAYEIDERDGRASPISGRRAPADIDISQSPAEAACAVAERVCRDRFLQPTEGEVDPDNEGDKPGQFEARFRPGKVIVLLADPPPPGRTPWKVGRHRRLGICIETPDRVNRALVAELAALARATTADLSRRALSGPPRGLLDLPPSLWGGYSPQRLVIASVYPAYRERNLGRFEESERCPAPQGAVVLQTLYNLLRVFWDTWGVRVKFEPRSAGSALCIDAGDTANAPPPLVLGDPTAADEWFPAGSGPPAKVVSFSTGDAPDALTGAVAEWLSRLVATRPDQKNWLPAGVGATTETALNALGGLLREWTDRAREEGRRRSLVRYACGLLDDWATADGLRDGTAPAAGTPGDRFRRHLRTVKDELLGRSLPDTPKRADLRAVTSYALLTALVGESARRGQNLIGNEKLPDLVHALGPSKGGSPWVAYPRGSLLALLLVAFARLARRRPDLAGSPRWAELGPDAVRDHTVLVFPGASPDELFHPDDERTFSLRESPEVVCPRPSAVAPRTNVNTGSSPLHETSIQFWFPTYQST